MTKVMRRLLSHAERLHALLMRNQVVRQYDDVTGTGSAVSQCLYGVGYQIIVVLTTVISTGRSISIKQGVMKSPYC
jgi:hypothetical protein